MTEWLVHVGQSLQLLLGLVFLVAGLTKLRQPTQFVGALRAYELIPSILERPIAAAVLALEILVSVSFLTGWALSASVPAASVLLLAFAAAVGINLRRGRVVPCGCFGAVGERISPHTLARIGLLLVAGIGLVAVRVAISDPLDAVSLIGEGVYGLEDLTYTAASAGFLLIFGMWLLRMPELAVVLRSPVKDEGA